jgi:hypothetical protein
VKLEPDMVNEWLTKEGWNCRNGWRSTARRSESCSQEASGRSALAAG